MYADSSMQQQRCYDHLEPSSADRFAERYAFNEWNFSDDWTLKQGVMDLLAIILRPQVVHDGTLGGSQHRNDMWRQLVPHQRFGGVHKGRTGFARHHATCQLIHSMIDKTTGQMFRPLD